MFYSASICTTLKGRERICSRLSLRTAMILWVSQNYYKGLKKNLSESSFICIHSHKSCFVITAIYSPDKSSGILPAVSRNFHLGNNEKEWEQLGSPRENWTFPVMKTATNWDWEISPVSFLSKTCHKKKIASGYPDSLTLCMLGKHYFCRRHFEI